MSEHLTIQIHHRTVREGVPSMTTISLGSTAPVVGPSSLAAADSGNGVDQELEIVAADPVAMAQALSEISQELGCPNTLEDMLHAIDELRKQPPAPRLQWSDTLCNNKRVDHAAAEQACAALGEGWRLPTRQELESILDLSRYEPSIDTERFPNTQSGAYWSSTPCAWSSDRAWVVGFSDGYSGVSHRSYDFAFVRAVRSVPAGQ